MFEDAQLAALLATLRADPWEETARLVLADWYGERADPHREQQCRSGPPPLSLWFLSGDGDGYGYGSGDGYGYGDGDGYGSGYGYGDGDGSGSGDGKPILGNLLTMPEPDGTNWLIVLPHGWVICGRVVAQTGPYSFRIEGAVVICRTGGVPWDELADGKRRDAATYRGWGTVNIGPQFVMSRHWTGSLPKVS